MNTQIKQTRIEHDVTHATEFKDTISYEGEDWLVSEWVVNPTKGSRFPKILISLKGLGYQPSGDHSSHFVVIDPLPHEILRGEVNEYKGKQIMILKDCEHLSFNLTT